MAPNPTDLLKKVREADEQQEVRKNPESKTLHPERIRQYLEDNDITADNFNDKFNFNSALEILKLKNTRGEAKMEQELSDARTFLDEIGSKDLLGVDAEDLMSDADPDTFQSSVHKLLMTREKLDQEKKVVNAHQKYLLIRRLAFRRLQVQKKFEVKREEDKTEVTDTLKEKVSGKYEELKKNFAKMSTGEKAVAVGAVLFSAVWLFSQSDNPKIQKFKDHAWKALKLVGVGVGANYAWKLWSGKTAYEALNDWSSSTAGSTGFMKETFKTDNERAEALGRSVIYMGDKDIMDLAKQYREAKANKTNKVDLSTVAESDMSSKDIYLALDAFFKKYSLETITKKYKNEDPDARTWRVVIGAEVTEDSRITMQKDVLDRTYDNVRYGFHNGYNWLVAGGFGASEKLYKWAWGKEGSQAEIKAWIESQGKNVVQSEKDLKDKLDVTARPSKHTSNYKDLLDKGHTKENVKYLRVAGESLYVMSSVKIEALAGDKKKLGDAWEKAQKQAEDFLKTQFPKHEKDIRKYIVPDLSASVVDESKFVLFARMPLPGTAEYHALNTGAKTPKDIAEQKELAVFEGELNYDEDLHRWEQERFRLHFRLDASQEADIKKVMKEISRRYRSLALPLDKVKEDMFENEEMRDEVLKAVGVVPKLRGNAELLGKIDEIEKDTAKEIQGKSSLYAQTIAEMKQMWGYKARLALLGDSDARKEMQYNPNKSYWHILPKGSVQFDFPPIDVRWTTSGLQAFLEQYEKLCAEYVRKRNRGEI